MSNRLINDVKVLNSANTGRILLSINFTEVYTLWQVSSNQAVDVFVGTPLPCCIGVGKITFDTKPDGKFLVFGILGAAIQGKRSSGFDRQLLSPLTDCFVGLSSTLAVDLGKQQETTFLFGQVVKGLLLQSIRDQAR